MAAELVAQNQQGTFADPQNATSPIDADEVTANDNALRVKFNTHDAEASIHVQSSILASRPAAGTLGRKWVTVDSGVARFWYDNGADWVELNYIRTDIATDVNGVLTFVASPVFADDVTFSQNVAVTGNLDVDGTTTVDGLTSSLGVTVQSGGTAVTGNSTVTGDLGVSGDVTANAFVGDGTDLTSLTATQLTGTISNARLPAAVSVTTVATSGAQTSGGGFVQTGGRSYEQITTSTGSGSVTVDAALTNWHKHTMSGNVTTFTISNMVAGQKLKLELVNQSTYTFAWGSVQNPSGMTIAPTANKFNYYEIVYGGNTQTIVLAALNIGNPL